MTGLGKVRSPNALSVEVTTLPAVRGPEPANLSPVGARQARSGVRRYPLRCRMTGAVCWMHSWSRTECSSTLPAGSPYWASAKPFNLDDC